VPPEDRETAHLGQGTGNVSGSGNPKARCFLKVPPSDYNRRSSRHCCVCIVPLDIDRGAPLQGQHLARDASHNVAALPQPGFLLLRDGHRRVASLLFSRLLIYVLPTRAPTPRLASLLPPPTPHRSSALPRFSWLVLGALTAFTAACSDAPLVPHRAALVPHSFKDVDLAPMAPGYFLQGASPAECYYESTPGTDADLDFINDNCEYELAYAFRPFLWYSAGEECSDGHPMWAVHRFVNDIIRIAYMPAYFLDCGDFGHDGDSEFIMVEVAYDYATHHWKYNYGWLSAHYTATVGGVNTDNSEWIGPTDVTYSDRQLGAPVIYVSANKHANYKNASQCNADLNLLDHCDNGFFTRLPLFSDRNVGSPTNDLVHCLYLTNQSRCETFFYANKAFAGWQGSDNSDSHGENSYFNILWTDRFQYRGSDPGYGARDPLAGNNFFATIDGPTAASPGNNCTWSAQTNICDSPSYQWLVNGSVAGTSYQFSYTAYSSFELQLVVSSATTAAQSSETIDIDQANGECFVQRPTRRTLQAGKLAAP